MRSILIGASFIASLIFQTPDYSENLREIFGSVKKKDWLQAFKLSHLLPNSQFLQEVLLSQKYLDGSSVSNKFENMLAFIQRHSQWPQKNRIISALEQTINNQTDLAEVYKWFDENPPKTKKGLQYQIISMLQTNQGITQEKLEEVIRSAFVKDSFKSLKDLIPKDINSRSNKISANQSSYLNRLQQIFRTFFKENDKNKSQIQNSKIVNDNILREVDYIEKASYLLSIDKPKEVSEILPLIDKRKHNFFNAWIALVKIDENGPILFKKLDHKERMHPGLLLSYLQYYKKKDQVNTEVITLLINTKHHIDQNFAIGLDEEKWLQVRTYFARELIKIKKYNLAYAVLKGYFGKERITINTIESIMGWLKLRFLHDSRHALIHFKKSYKVSTRAGSLAKSYYWIGRTYKAMNHNAKARKWFTKGANFGYNFYGQLCLTELKVNKLLLPKSPMVTTKELSEVLKDDLAKFIWLAAEYGDQELAIIYGKHFIDLHKAYPNKVAALLKFLEKYPYVITQLSRHALTSNVFNINGYPTHYEFSHPWVIDKSLVYAIIRHESSFNHSSFSTLNNDSGLMQIIPNTACETAKNLNITCDLKRLTTDPYYNIKLGSKHIYDRIKYYQGSYILGIASYNAGIKPVNKWIEHFGDPRKMNITQIIDWIELIPFVGTRDYVKKVLEGLQVYRTIVTQDHRLQLIDDLKLKNFNFQLTDQLITSKKTDDNMVYLEICDSNKCKPNKQVVMKHRDIKSIAKVNPISRKNNVKNIKNSTIIRNKSNTKTK